MTVVNRNVDATAGTANELRVLLVEDSETDAKLIAHELRRAGYLLEMERVQQADEMRAALDRAPWNVVISDWFMPRFSALAALALLKEVAPDIPFILVSGTIGEETAAEAMRAGARDFLVKGRLARLGTAVERELRQRRSRQAQRQSEAARTGILQAALDAIIGLDDGGYVIEFNEAAVKMFDYSRDEALGKRLADLLKLPAVHEAHLAWMESYRGAAAGPVLGSRIETSALRRDGAEFPVEVAISRLPSEGRPTFIAFVRDISERRRAEDALRASEEQVRLLLESTGEGIYGIDVKGNCTFANAACLRMLGYREVGDLLGKDVHELTHHTRADGTALPVGDCRIYRTGLQGEGAHVDDEIFWRADGSSFAVEYRSFPLRRGGESIGAVVSFADTSERRAAEEQARLLHTIALAVGEAGGVDETLDVVLRKICEVGGFGFASVWMPVPQGRLECRRNWAPSGLDERVGQFTEGWSLEKGEGLPGRVWASGEPGWIADVGHDPKCPRATLARELGLRAAFAVPVLVDDQVIAVIETFLHEVREPDARTTRLVSAVAAQIGSVLQRRRAEEALRTSEARFRRLSESGLIGIAFADVSGNVHDANDTYLDMFGYSREELLSGKARWADITPPEWRAMDELAIQQLQTNGFAPAWEKEMIRKDGARVPVLIGVAMLEGPDCIAFIADLSKRKQAEEALRKSEEQLRQSQKMEAIGQLAGGIAHDFNNLLAVIMANSSFLLGELGEGDPRRADADEIRLAAERAATLTRQLLAFSRRQVLELRVMDVNDVVTGVEKMLRRVIGEDVELVTALAPDLGMIRADPSQIEQVVLNLVVNARDAMPGGGKLRIETANVELDAAYALEHRPVQSGPYVLLSISDTGCGMDRETQRRMFEPFFTTKEMGKGTGLGLSTCYGIVKQSGGYIWAYSEPGRGTVFKIYLPRVEAKPEPRPERKTALDLRGSETVLLVEDDDKVRAVAQRILEAGGYRLLLARNATEAMAICEQEKGLVDLVLSDVVMPGLSGPALLEQLRKLRPYVKVLFMSGYMDHSVHEPGSNIEPGVNLIQKPFTPDTLMLKVREILDNR
jgi:two-component system cell cycle sensor histidine kinase/response regulator CckA